MNGFHIVAFVFACLAWAASIHYEHAQWFAYLIFCAVAALYAHIGGGLATIEFNQLQPQDQTFPTRIKYGIALSFFPLAAMHTVSMLSIGSLG